jgi:aldose 1-epimerase
MRRAGRFSRSPLPIAPRPIGKPIGRQSPLSGPAAPSGHDCQSLPTRRSKLVRPPDAEVPNGAASTLCRASFPRNAAAEGTRRRLLADVIELNSDAVTARIEPATGGRIVSLVVGDVERLLSKERGRATALPTYWGCYPMVPWAGRLANGRIPTPDGEVRLEPNLPPSAIHGLGFEAPWAVLDRSETAVTMACALRGRGWPFGGEARQILRLSAGSLDLELEVGGYTRAGPAGLGWHPWFARPETGDLEVMVAAREVLVLDCDKVPTGEVREVTASEDLRSGPTLGDRRLDHVYIRATGPAIVRWPDLELRVEYDQTLNTVVVHTPEAGVCVEPQSMWPNAPLLAARGVPGTGLRTLAPGEHLRARERWTWHQRRDVR